MARDFNPPDWLERTDVIRARVRLTEHDYAVLLALPQGDVLPKVQRLLDLAASALGGLDWSNPQSGSLRDRLAALRQMLGEDNLRQSVALVDELLTQAIESWQLGDIAQAYGLGKPPPVPGTLGDPAQREAVYDSLPVSAIRRLLEGLVIHSGNP